MKEITKQSVKFQPYFGFMIFLYLNLLVGAVLAICAIAIIAHVGLHDFFYNPKVFDFIHSIKNF